MRKTENSSNWLHPSRTTSYLWPRLETFCITRLEPDVYDKDEPDESGRRIDDHPRIELLLARHAKPKSACILPMWTAIDAQKTRPRPGLTIFMTQSASPGRSPIRDQLRRGLSTRPCCASQL